MIIKTIDIHGLTAVEAKSVIRAATKECLYRGNNVELMVIHGFNHGTAVRDTIARRYPAAWVMPENPGRSIIPVMINGRPAPRILREIELMN